MEQNKIFFWKQPEDEKHTDALGHIDLNMCQEEFVKLLPSDVCARRYTFQLLLFRQRADMDRDTLMTSSRGDVTETKHWICCENEENRFLWMSAINKQLSDAAAWKGPSGGGHHLRQSALSHV